MSDKENVIIREQGLPGKSETQKKNQRRRRSKKKKSAALSGEDVAKIETGATGVLGDNNKANISKMKNKNLSNHTDVNTSLDNRGNHEGVQDREKGNRHIHWATDSNKQQRTKGRSRMDRYYGRFSCKICRKTWESAFVFTRAGTKKVLFKQRCKNCTGDDAWVMPYRLELLRCSICQSEICNCTCEDCGMLKHRRWIVSPDDPEESIEDPTFEYCTCDKRGRGLVGDSIDPKKPHRSDLCEKCLKGHPCTQRRESMSDDLSPDNEP